MLIFMAAQASGFALLNDPAPVMDAARPVAAVAGVFLLVADVFLPVPSILVMVANGALFGVFWGTLLSLVGSLGAALTGFAVGRAGEDLVRRFVTPKEHERAGAMLQRWGVLAIAVSRPVPILAETVAILAGSSPLTWTQAFLAAFAGSLAPCLAYAWAGSAAGTLGMQTLIFAGILATTALMLLVIRRTQIGAPGT